MNITVLDKILSVLLNSATSLQEIVRRETPDEDIRSAFTSMKEEGKLLPCSVSVAKLLRILSQDKFASGDHVDYYDE